MAEGRNMTTDQVDEIGRGHVYSATDAIEIGLVDEIGGMNVAVKAAAEAAGTENYRIVKYPKLESPFEKLITDFTGDMEAKILKKKLGANYILYEQLEKLEQMKGIQARMPFTLTIE